MRDSKDDLLVEYYASHRASVIINYNEITQSREIGRVFAEYKDKLVVIDGEDKKEQCIFSSQVKRKSLRR